MLEDTPFRQYVLNKLKFSVVSMKYYFCKPSGIYHARLVAYFCSIQSFIHRCNAIRDIDYKLSRSEVDGVKKFDLFD